MNPQPMREYLRALRRAAPEAVARVRGQGAYAALKGDVYFLQTENSVLVAADFTGLPDTDSEGCVGGVHGFHIHAGTNCTGTAEMPYADADGHYNPHGCAHPYHAGDLPPLFSMNGTAFMAVATNRFRVSEILGHTVIVHADADDFRTQPSGASGAMIGCGVIERFKR